MSAKKIPMRGRKIDIPALDEMIWGSYDLSKVRIPGKHRRRRRRETGEDGIYNDSSKCN